MSKVSFAGKDFFARGEHEVRAESWRRERVSHTFAGLDGVLSVDLGRRERKLVQRGTLAAENVEALQNLVKDIEGYLDGEDHELIDQYGRIYTQVRMERFRLTSTIGTGNQARADYEIEYIQTA